MQWLSEAAREIWTALGVRRYTIGAIIATGLTIVAAVYSYFTGDIMDPLTTTILAGLILVSVILIALLGHIVRLRREITPSIDMIFMGKEIEEDGFYVHLRAVNRGAANATGCVATLERIQFLGNTVNRKPYVNPLQLGWASNPANRFVPISIPPAGIHSDRDEQRFRLIDVLFARPAGIYPQTFIPDPAWFLDEGQYFLTIHITSDNALSRDKHLLVTVGKTLESFDVVEASELPKPPTFPRDRSFPKGAT